MRGNSHTDHSRARRRRDDRARARLTPAYANVPRAMSSEDDDDDVSSSSERDDGTLASSSEELDDDEFALEDEAEDEDEQGTESDSDDEDDSDGDSEDEESEDEALARPVSNQMMGMARAFQTLVGDEDGDDAELLPKTRKQREEELDAKAEEKERREKKRVKLEIKQRGHVKPTPKGRDVESDMLERRLHNTATKGVVRLFKAVAKAQEDAEKAKTMRRKDALISKSKFLEELRGQSKKSSETEETKASSKASFLHDDFMLGSGKMKDWDKEQDVAAKDLEYDEEEDDVF